MILRAGICLPISANVMECYAIQGPKVPPTTSYSLVTKQAVTRGLLTKRVIPTLLLTGTSGSGSFVVVVLWLPDLAYYIISRNNHVMSTISSGVDAGDSLSLVELTPGR